MFVSIVSFDLARGGAVASDSPTVQAARALPSARMCLWGTLRKMAGPEPEQQSAVLVGFDDRADLPRVLDAAGDAALANVRVETIDARVEVALEPRRPGQRFFALVASFDYGPAAGPPAVAEKHYFEYHVARSRELPGLRGYVIGALVPSGSRGQPRARMGLEIFDDRRALVDSFRSPVGEEMVRDGAYVCGNVLVHHFAATVER
jgi:uncharacterized protein (TIGR02118 family)